MLPALTKPGVIEGVGTWRRCIVRPGDIHGDLSEGLASCLLEAVPELKAGGTDAVKLAGVLNGPAETVAVVLAAALANAAKETGEQPAHALGCRLFLVIDQMEELFTLERFDPEQREQFSAALSALARSGCAWVLATMRSDFYPHCGELPALAALKDDGQYDLAHS